MFRPDGAIIFFFHGDPLYENPPPLFAHFNILRSAPQSHRIILLLTLPREQMPQVQN